MQDPLTKAMAELRACHERQLAAEDQDEFDLWGRLSRHWEVEVQRLLIAKRAQEAERIGNISNNVKGR